MAAAVPYRLLAACWTSAGDVQPIDADDHSPVPIERRVRAVAAAGFTGLGLNRADLLAVRDGLGYAAFAELLEANGIRELQLELIDHWWETGPRRAESDRARADLLEAARRLPVESLKIASDNSGGAVDLAAMPAALATLGQEAAEAGTRVALEACAFSGVPSLVDAVAVVRDADHPAVGVLLDLWHLVRAGFPVASIGEVVPPALLFGVELDDARLVQVGTGLEDTFDRRILCGRGEGRTIAFIREVLALGWRGPWGVEHMSIRHRSLPVEAAVAEAGRAAVACLRAAEGVAG